MSKISLGTLPPLKLKMQSTLIYRSGDAFLPKSIVDFLSIYIVGNDKSLFYLNLWSIVHFTVGVVVGVIFRTMTYRQALVIHLLWELWQMAIGMTKITPRGLLDSGVDTVMFMLGFWLTRKF